jgi:hypothetical protein
VLIKVIAGKKLDSCLHTHRNVILITRSKLAREERQL